MKKCTKCGEVKDLSCFSKNVTKKDGYSFHCKECKKTFYKEDPIKHRERTRKNYFYDADKARTKSVSGYEITKDEYYLLLSKQERKCAICGKTEEDNKRALAIDHCHTTNKVRGLLCTCCNTALGKFKDSTELLHNAITYLLNPPFNKDKDNEVKA